MVESPQKLPSSRTHVTAQAVYAPEPLLAAAGGIDANQLVLNDLTTYSFGSFGKLSDPVIHEQMPLPLYDPMLAAHNGGLIMAGGRDSLGNPSRKSYEYLFSTGMWSVQEAPFTATGSWHVKSNGRLWAQDSGKEYVSLIKHSLLHEPSLPDIFPGSGFVGSSVRPTVTREPGSTVFFQTAGSSEWTTDIPYLSGCIQVRSGMNGIYSPAASFSYQVQDLGLAIFISATYDADDTGSRSAKIGNGVSEQWWRIIQSSGDKFTIHLTDSRIDQEFTAEAELTLYELDLHTPVLDNHGSPVLDRNSLNENPMELSLNPGTYYLHIRADEGTTFAISFGK